MAYIVELLTGILTDTGRWNGVVTHHSMTVGAESRCQWTPGVEAERLAKVDRQVGRGYPDKNG